MAFNYDIHILEENIGIGCCKRCETCHNLRIVKFCCGWCSGSCDLCVGVPQGPHAPRRHPVTDSRSTPRATSDAPTATVSTMNAPVKPAVSRGCHVDVRSSVLHAVIGGHQRVTHFSTSPDSCIFTILRGVKKNNFMFLYTQIR